MKNLKTSTLYGLFMLLMVAATARASQTSYIGIDTSTAPASGSAASVSGSFTVKNTSSVPIVIKARGLSPENARLTYAIANSALAPNETARVSFRGALLRTGAAYAEIEVLNAAGRVLDQQVVELSFEITNGSFRKLDESVAPRSLSFATSSVEPRTDTPPYRIATDDIRQGPSAEEMKRVPARLSIDDFAMMSGASRTGRPNAHALFAWAGPEVSPEPVANTTTINGEFRYRGLDDANHPAALWAAEMWTYENNQTKQKIGVVWVGWDGKWTGSVPAAYDGKKIVILYKAVNDFFELRNQYLDIPHTLPVFVPEKMNAGTSIKSSTWFDFSYNTQNPENVGIGDMYNEGIRLWLAFYNAGIEVVNTSRYIAYYPNHTHDCSGQSGGSCGTPHTNLLYISRWDMVRRGVMQHELAHKIHARYWSGSSSLEDAKGIHILNSCSANETLAMSEGFANFIPFWVEYGPSSSSFGKTLLSIYDIEVPYSDCPAAYRSETLIAGTFWDLYDRHPDGADDLYWVNKGTVVKIFLTSGGHSSMSQLRQVYIDKSGPNYKNMVGKIFDENSKP